MTYCRYCGIEIRFKQSKNQKWIPCDAITGAPHFCNKTAQPKSLATGLIICSTCGKPCFVKTVGRKKIIYDYSTLKEHECLKRNITNYSKYKKRTKISSK